MSKRILLVNEASFYPTGLGWYGHYLLKGFKEHGFKVAELSQGADFNHALDNAEWRVYGINNNENNDPNTMYGKARFTQACLDFKPHVVININDPWTVNWINHTPLRRFFRLVLCPTIDSLPLKPEWRAYLNNADLVLGWSDWAKESVPQIKQTMRYGVDFDKFYITECTKKKLGLEGVIVGSVMKNQPRKLYNEFFAIISHLRKLDPNIKGYIHGSVPDQRGWDVQELLIRYELAEHMYFSYECTKCGAFQPSLFRGELATCEKCSERAAMVKPMTATVDMNTMRDLYNAFDAYVQCSAAEGAGMPVAEAAACGILTYVPPTSAMNDFVDTLHSIELLVGPPVFDYHQRAYRSYIQPERSASIIFEGMQSRRDREAIRHRCQKYYDWNILVSKWIHQINGLPKAQQWGSPKQLISVPTSNDIFETLMFIKDHSFDPYEVATLFKRVTNSGNVPNPYLQKMTPQELINYAHSLEKLWNDCELVRSGESKLSSEPYIRYAQIKGDLYE